MPRPKRPRHITSHPVINEFRPGGEGSREMLILSLEELEVIRLIDYEGLDQSQAAEAMKVSRQTVGRILKSGRFTLSKALVQGHGIRVEGGCYKLRGQGRGQRRGQGNGCGRGRRQGGSQTTGQERTGEKK